MTLKNIEYYKKLKIILTVSNFVKDTLLEFGFEGKIHVIYNPVNKCFYPLKETKNELRRKLNLPIDKKLVLSVSANYPRKNLKIIEDTMEVLGSDYKLIRVGSPLKDSLTFTNIPNEKLNQIYNACDVFFIPSRYEGFGLPVIEAFSSGVPVVGSDIPVFQEISDGAALLCPQDSKAYTQAIKAAIQMSDELMLKGTNRAKFFSMGNYCKKLNSFYEEAFKLYGIE